MSDSPYEILIAQFALYVGPVGEAYPAVEDAPAGNWVLVGTSGGQNYDESGVQITHDQSTNPIRVYGTTGPRKMVRVSEDLRIVVNLMDMTLEEYTRIISDVAPADTVAGGGAAGFREIDLLRGLTPSEKALLLRAEQSPYGDGWNYQYEIPKAVNTSSPTVSYVKGDAPVLGLEYTAVEDPDAASDSERFGRIVVQDAAVV